MAEKRQSCSYCVVDVASVSKRVNHADEIKSLKLNQLMEFKNHPFKIEMNTELFELMQSIEKDGVLVPLLARPNPNGTGYELISGHRRKAACEWAGIDEVPVIIRELDDCQAVIAMVDSNLQREKVKPSEKAFAYRMKLEAMKQQGKRTDITGPSWTEVIEYFIRYEAEKQNFIAYLSKNKEVTFQFENQKYSIRILRVLVFPQCYAAVADIIATFTKRTLIVDIGSWTIDIMPVVNKAPDESKCVTIPKGLITCMRSINEQCVRRHNGEIDEVEIQNIMRYGKTDLDEEYFTIVKQEIETFAQKVYNSIREYGYNLTTTPIVFVGGGAVVMKNYGKCNQKNISYILDVKANAKGYEQLARLGLKSMKKIG